MEHCWENPYWIKEINAACLECLLFEKLTAGRMDGETDQKNLIWLPSFSRLWGSFKVRFCVSQLSDGQCELWWWTVPLFQQAQALENLIGLILQGLARHQHLISKAVVNYYGCSETVVPKAAVY